MKLWQKPEERLRPASSDKRKSIPIVGSNGSLGGFGGKSLDSGFGGGLAKGVDGVLGWDVAQGAVRHISLAELIRPLNCLIASLGVFVGFSVASGAIAFNLQLLLAMASAFLITAAGNTINDFFDIAIDSKRSLKTPLTRGDVDPRIAFAFSIMLFVAGILLAFFTTQSAFLIAVIVSVMLIIYSAAMQSHKYLGNVVVSAGTALTIVFGAALTGNYIWASIFASSAFLANLGREITKDFEDMEIDDGSKKTLPMLLSFAWAQRIVFTVYSVAIIIAGTAWTNGIVNGNWFILLLLTSAIFFFVAWEEFSEKRFWDSQKTSKIGMVVALLAFLSIAL